jgi:cytoskeleton protein RodZ
MQEISELLKKRRAERKLTLEEIRTRTRIPISYIEGLESWDPSKFPAEVYLLGTLRRYANFLGLDSAEIVRMYKEWKKPKEPQKTVKQAEEKKKERPFNWIYFVAVAVFFIVAIVS